VRFVVSAIVLFWYAVSFAQTAARAFPPPVEPLLPYTLFVWRGVHHGPEIPVFVIAALMLGLGGLQQERASGTAPFTLALPVNRIRIAAARAAVAIAEVAVLGAIPAIGFAWTSTSIAREPYALADAWPFALLFASAGAVLVSGSFAWSTVCSSEHATIMAVLATLAAYVALVLGTPLHDVPRINLLDVMSGSRMSYFDGASGLITVVPWATIVALWSIAIAGMAFGVLAADHQEF
jgi:hypothetical protein